MASANTAVPTECRWGGEAARRITCVMLAGNENTLFRLFPPSLRVNSLFVSQSPIRTSGHFPLLGGSVRKATSSPRSRHARNSGCSDAHKEKIVLN